jgi:6-pyruvoyl-tetrahydropterin synthase
MKMRIVRVGFFSAGHAYSENERYGHNFKVEAHFDCANPTNDSINSLEKILKDVITIIDHRYLNKDLKEFKNKPATPETIALFCFSEIQKRLSKRDAKLIKTRIFEGDRVWADAFASDISEGERDF